MEHFDCDGWMHITLDDENLGTAVICMMHYQCHHPYLDISVLPEIGQEIERLKDLSAAKIWQAILKKHPGTELTQKQVYTYWAHIHEATWRLDNDQVKSAIKLLEHVNDIDIEIIPVPTEAGISSLAFGFKNILADYGEELHEIAVDSTWQTNALSYELYAVMGEADGRALPLAFAFTCSTDGNTAPGAKDRMLQDVLRCITQYCPNIVSVNTDKDQTELSAVNEVFPYARRQLCYWHAIRYLETRLAEDKPPAKYDHWNMSKSRVGVGQG
ncbi:hypothetical protein L208DRAFT_1406196 [Tricholoma matsutake]|nr:hypothetical protein L208DRAFT_1406196 [Tricholoma matsutake 945]